MPARSYKRRQLLVKKTLQYKIIGLVLGAVLVAVGIIAIDMFSSLGSYLSDTGADVAGLYDNIKYALIVKVTVFMVGVFFLALMISHKVAGPVYRFEKSAALVEQGDLTSLVFLRKGDELVELREGFNAMISSVREKVSTDASHADRVRRLLEAVLRDGGLPSGAAKKVQEAVEQAGTIGKSFKF